MVGLIFPSNLKFAPYVQYYIDALNEEGIAFETISWDKKNLDEKVDYAYHFSCDDGNRSKILLGHFRFSCFVKQVILHRRYERLVIFTIAPLFFLTPLLSRRYNKRFVMDVRDASPFVSAFPKWFQRIAKKAARIVMSSPNFKNWIPCEGILGHNCSVEVLRRHRDDATPQSNALPLRFACAGMLNEVDINIRFIDAANDGTLFEHWYIGPTNSGKQRVIDHVQQSAYTNVHFMGQYNKGDIVSIYREHADFVNIIRRECAVNRDALPNKLYDAVIAGRPCIVPEHNSAIVKLVEKYRLGIVVTQEILDDPTARLVPLCQNFSYKDFAVGRRAFIEDVLRENDAFRAMIKTLNDTTA